MRLKELRIAKGFLQKDVAEMLGVDRTTYVKYENETSEPNVETLIKLADIFGVSIDYLLGRMGNFGEPTPLAGKDEIKNPDIRMVARAGQKMTSEQAENLRKYAQYMFPEAFKDGHI